MITQVSDLSVPERFALARHLVERGKAETSPAKKAGAMNLLDWTITRRRYLSPGKLLTFRDHLFLVDLFLCEAQVIVVKKSSQLGVSEWAICYCTHACDERGMNLIYTFPTDTHVSDFSSARLGPGIETSEYLEQIVSEAAEKPGGGRSSKKRRTDRVTLKRIRNNFLYFRGARVTPDGLAPQLKSIDADAIIADEVNEMDKRALPIARKRLGHSRFAEERIISTPTYTNTGIDLEWRETDQREWFIPCSRCAHWQTVTIHSVVTEWDALGRPVAWHGQKEGKAWAACRKCGRALDRWVDGAWVAKHPGREKVGFHPTKFAYPRYDLLQIVKSLDTVDETKRRETVNQDLGEDYTPRGGRITDETLDACRRDYPHAPVPGDRPFMGVDVGSTFYVVIRSGRNPETGEFAQRLAVEVDTWDEVGRLMYQFAVKSVVIDANPEYHAVRQFQASWPQGVVWLAYYNVGEEGNKKIETATWDEKNYTVTIDRTRSLDAMFARFYEGKNTLPAYAQDIKDYYSQIKAPVRQLVERKKGKVAVYIEDSEDHFAHAENYCQAAMAAPQPPEYAEASRVSVRDFMAGEIGEEFGI